MKTLSHVSHYAIAAVALVSLAACGGQAQPLVPRDASSSYAEQPRYAGGRLEAGEAQARVSAARPTDDGGPSPSAPMGALEAEGRSVMEPAPERRERPGLATQWGETRTSRVTSAPFERADGDNPSALASFFYNDTQGARAMAGYAGYNGANSFEAAAGAIRVALRDEDSGRYLSGYRSGSGDVVVGEAGHRYSIILRNTSPERLECVVSVDGLDVIDGRDASYGKRGYLVSPYAELRIDGFRQSDDSVAAFRFGSVRDSYAQQKHGDARNVGVIGVAVFREEGADWRYDSDELERRRNAEPFPSRFASPP